MPRNKVTPSPTPRQAVDRARAEAEARKQWQREDDARTLAHAREHGWHGGPFNPTFDVPLAKGGIIALLTRADLSSEASAEPFFGMFSTATGTRPTLPQLRLAQGIARALDAAIMVGDDPGTWELVQRAYDALDATMAKRRAVVAILDDLQGYSLRTDELRAWWTKHRPGKPYRGDDQPGSGVEFRTFKALESLAILDSRFATVCVCRLVELVRAPRLAALGIATKLTLACGAFDEAPAPHESDQKAFRRVKRNYEKAFEEVPT